MDNKKCPNCGKSDNIDRNLKCHSCGSQLEFDHESNTYNVKLIDCPECGQSNSVSANYCSKCRKKLLQEEAVLEVKEKKDVKILGGILVLIAILVCAFYIYTVKPDNPLQPSIRFNNHKKNAPITGTKRVFAVIAQNRGPRMDVVFCVDTTGSMGDEIDVIKAQLLKMVDEIRQGQPPPEVRFGVVAYRDREDEYITKKYPLQDEIQKTQEIINSLKAAGGGDYEESINEALHVAIEKINWDKEKNVKKIIFLIGDASPHTDYPNDYDYKKEIALASKKGIMINTISCSGMQEDGNQFFQKVAQATNGTFEYLTYRYSYEDVNGNKHVKLNQAGKDYIVDDKYVEDEGWRSGASDMATKNKAVEAPSYTSGPASVTSGSYSEGDVRGGSKVEQVNNLDSIMTNKLKEEAKKSGSKFKE